MEARALSCKFCLQLPSFGLVMVDVMRMMCRTVVMALKRGEDESNLELNLMYEFLLNADIKFSPNHQLLGMVIYRRNSYQSYRIHILFKESNGTWSVVYHWANPVTLGISRSRGGMTR